MQLLAWGGTEDEDAEALEGGTPVEGSISSGALQEAKRGSHVFCAQTHVVAFISNGATLHLSQRSHCREQETEEG